MTTGEVGEGDMIEAQVDEVRAAAGQEIGTAAADAPVPLRCEARDHEMPEGKVLRPGKPQKYRRFFHAEAKDCTRCPFRNDCLFKQSGFRIVVIGDDYPALPRARRRGLGNMNIQSCLTAAAINLKRLAAVFHARIPASGMLRMREMLVSALLARWTSRIRRMRTDFA